MTSPYDAEAASVATIRRRPAGHSMSLAEALKDRNSSFTRVSPYISPWRQAAVRTTTWLRPLDPRKPKAELMNRIWYHASGASVIDLNETQVSDLSPLHGRTALRLSNVEIVA